MQSLSFDNRHFVCQFINLNVWRWRPHAFTGCHEIWNERTVLATMVERCRLCVRIFNFVSKWRNFRVFFAVMWNVLTDFHATFNHRNWYKNESTYMYGFYFPSVSKWRSFCWSFSQLPASSEIYCSQNY